MEDFNITLHAVTFPGGMVQPYETKLTIKAKSKDDALSMASEVFSKENPMDTLTNMEIIS